MNARIRQDDEHYHWPRSHSLAKLIGNLRKLGLVEPTGVLDTSPLVVLQGDPLEGASPGDLRLDPHRGFRQRVYYRLTAGAEADLAWDNPMGALRIVYGFPVPAPPLQRPAGAPAPARRQRLAALVRQRPPEPSAPAAGSAGAPAAPRRARGGRRVAAGPAAAPEAAPAPGLLALGQRLQLRREALYQQARAAA